jgi:hypothetical protein
MVYFGPEGAEESNLRLHRYTYGGAVGTYAEARAEGVVWCWGNEIGHHYTLVEVLDVVAGLKEIEQSLSQRRYMYALKGSCEIMS